MAFKLPVAQEEREGARSRARLSSVHSRRFGSCAARFPGNALHASRVTYTSQTLEELEAGSTCSSRRTHDFLPVRCRRYLRPSGVFATAPQEASKAHRSILVPLPSGLGALLCSTRHLSSPSADGAWHPHRASCIRNPAMWCGRSLLHRHLLVPCSDNLTIVGPTGGGMSGACRFTSPRSLPSPSPCRVLSVYAPPSPRSWPRVGTLRPLAPICTSASRRRWSEGRWSARACPHSTRILTAFCLSRSQRLGGASSVLRLCLSRRPRIDACIATRASS
jgi:hypothetical protein